MTAFLVLFMFVAFIIVDAIVVALRRRLGRGIAAEVAPPMRQPQPPFGLFLDEGHAWARLASDGTLRVGIDDFLSEAIGKVSAARLPRPGEHVERGQPLLRLQVGGRELIVPAPVSGQVLGVNTEIASTPSLLTMDPYGLGWAVTVLPRDPKAAIAPLHIGQGALAFLRLELGRLTELLTAEASRRTPLGALADDGGVPVRGALLQCDDETFTRFGRELLGSSADGQ